MLRIAGLLFIGVIFTVVLRAQDTLPPFTAAARGPGKILISWRNKYPAVSQISIQRSTDSLKGFSTLITVPDPHLQANGIVDNKATHPNFYYRLFIVMEDGQYLFTPSRRPGSNTGETPAVAAADNADTAAKETEAIIRAQDTRVLFFSPADSRTKTTIKTPTIIHGTPELAIANVVNVRKGDSLIARLSGPAVQKFRDSILRHSKDTLVFIDGDTLLIKPFVAKEVYKQSTTVYTGKYGNIHIALPDAVRKHYAVKFFDEDNKLLFEIAEIHDPSLILDKTNFHHSGWFHFELYDGDQLKEKNKFYIPREF